MLLNRRFSIPINLYLKKIVTYVAQFVCYHYWLLNKIEVDLCPVAPTIEIKWLRIPLRHSFVRSFPTTESQTRLRNRLSYYPSQTPFPVFLSFYLYSSLSFTAMWNPDRVSLATVRWTVRTIHEFLTEPGSWSVRFEKLTHAMRNIQTKFGSKNEIRGKTINVQTKIVGGFCPPIHECTSGGFSGDMGIMVLLKFQ